ncbi:MAG: hypothetical protein JO321_10600 [Solirubrobacterales bacterium]|nr:hypothetical protein [Solirubrobacterales bacterium]MBV9535847.1 hypothetical protein [Solirubrobacterales bacterium]
MQALADVHDTPDSPLSIARAGFGVFWIAHLVPFQRSANVTRKDVCAGPRRLVPRLHRPRIPRLEHVNQRHPLHVRQLAQATAAKQAAKRRVTALHGD